MYYATYKKIIITLIILIIVGAGTFFFLKKSNKNSVQTPPSEIVSNSSAAPVVPSASNTVTTSPTPTPPKPVVVPLPVGTDQFVVSLTSTSDGIATNLHDGGYITDAASFSASIGAKPIASGAYKISKKMTPAQLLQVLRGKPYMKWVVIPPGLRKEEIANLLTPALGWTPKQKTEWIIKDTTTKPEYIEGVYAPDTYLIPVGETPLDVTTRLIAKFNEGFTPYLPEFTAKNIKWTTGLTLASLVQREAASVADMPLISGILWNRLNNNMMLGVDATLQYIRGDTGNGWWAPITVADKKIDSPYNTYTHTGLPPHPIANPSFNAIDAALNPMKTDCLYYLHDKNRVTHCAATYEEHQANIEKYLKNSTN
jgi:uncharacterized YceG family protein